MAGDHSTSTPNPVRLTRSTRLRCQERLWGRQFTINMTIYDPGFAASAPGDHIARLLSLCQLMRYVCFGMPAADSFLLGFQDPRAPKDVQTCKFAFRDQSMPPEMPAICLYWFLQQHEVLPTGTTGWMFFCPLSNFRLRIASVVSPGRKKEADRTRSQEDSREHMRPLLQPIPPPKPPPAIRIRSLPLSRAPNKAIKRHLPPCMSCTGSGFILYACV